MKSCLVIEGTIHSGTLTTAVKQYLNISARPLPSRPPKRDSSAEDRRQGRKLARRQQATAGADRPRKSDNQSVHVRIKNTKSPEADCGAPAFSVSKAPASLLFMHPTKSCGNDLGEHQADIRALACCTFYLLAQPLKSDSYPGISGDNRTSRAAFTRGLLQAVPISTRPCKSVPACSLPATSAASTVPTLRHTPPVSAEVIQHRETSR